MSSFTSPLETLSLPDGKNKKILRTFRYFVIDKHLGPYITVPNGFISDGASIPKFLWSIVGSPWSGKYTQAAVLHDWLYRREGLVIIPIPSVYFKHHLFYNNYEYVLRNRLPNIFNKNTIIKQDLTKLYIKFSRKACDTIFKDAMKLLGVASWRRNLIYTGVRVGGRFSYRMKITPYISFN